MNLKADVAEAALNYIPDDCLLGVGTGSTVNAFIDALVNIKSRLEACIPSSKATEIRLRQLGFPVMDLNSAGMLTLYVDGADEVNQHGVMIKGGGGALTGEKIVASASTSFLCLVDESKVVSRLGAFPVAVEVIPMARSTVARALVRLGGNPVYREGFVTDHGNIILDVFNLSITTPIQLEEAINAIPGVVENGLFAARCADRVLVASHSGVRLLSDG